MTPAPPRPSGIVPDANVLIDYVDSDRGILALITKHIAPIHVSLPIAAEVRQLSAKEAIRLGLDIVEPTLTQATEAAQRRGATSFQDRLCMIVARDSGWSCMTNDKALRTACKQAGVSCIWGLEAMGMLVRAGHLRGAQACAVADQIAASNPFITPAIIARFQASIAS